MRNRWWRRNGWALLALPLVAALAWWVSGYRYTLFYLPWHLHEPVSGGVGEVVHLEDTLDQVFAKATLDIAVDLSVGPTRPVPFLVDPSGRVVPTNEEGFTTWRTDLTVTADPSTVLSGCAITLVDPQGRTTDYDPMVSGGLSTPACVPAHTPGPGDPSLPADEDTPPRPGTYTVPVWFTVPDTVEPDELWISWGDTRYARFELEVQR